MGADSFLYADTGDFVKFSEYTKLVKSDLYRYIGLKTCGAFIKCLFILPGFKYSFLIRTARYLSLSSRVLILLYGCFRLALLHYQIKYGISIPYNADIGPGLYIGHYGGIFVHYETKIGTNCNINNGVTIGATYGGKHPGVPRIGNNVYLGPGSKVIGGINVGNNVAIGANCVVTTNIPDDAVVVGVPGKIISYRGACNYVVNTHEVFSYISQK
jgi:serine O-acetyltransferase